AAGARRRPLADAGDHRAAGRRDADDLIRDVAMFIRIVERMLVLQPVLPQPRQDAAEPGTARPAHDARHDTGYDARREVRHDMPDAG
ncbi:hypothetical protein ABT314_42850, partial [Streptomyces spiralis]